MHGRDGGKRPIFAGHEGWRWRLQGRLPGIDWEISSPGVSVLVGGAHRWWASPLCSVSPGGARTAPPGGKSNYEARTAWFFSGSQILILRVSGMMNRQMMKQTA